MDVKIQTVWTANFANTLSGMANFGRWLVILNLSISLTYVTQYFQWTEQNQQAIKDSTVLGLPWTTLKNFYEESMDSLALYNQQVATPWSQLCYVTWWNYTNHPTYFTGRCVAGERSPLAPLDSARTALEKYSLDLTRIGSAHENGIVFNDLSKDQLGSLCYLVQFSYPPPIDSLKKGWKEAVNLALAFRDTNCVKARERDSMAEVVNLPLLAVTDPPPKFEDFITHSGLKNRDHETFRDSLITYKLQQLQSFLDSNSLETLGTVTADKAQAEDKIKEFKSGNSIGIPLTSISVSLAQFVTVAGFINLFIIVYFFILFRRIQALWKVYTEALAEPAVDIAKAYFFYWTWNIRSYPFFMFCLTLLLSYISVISFVFSYLIYAISEPRLSGHSPVVSGIFAGANVVLAFAASRRYYGFKKKIGC
jgi:hypothetical protein